MSDASSELGPLDMEDRISVPGGKVWCGVAGELGQRAFPLLVLHGGPGMNHEYLLPLADLADERPVVFYDQLEAGASERPADPANWNVARFLEEIDAVRTALGLGQVALFGNSWGGTLAAAYGAQRPDGLRSLVLSSPLIRTDIWIADNEQYRNALPENLKTIMAACEAEGRTDDPAYQAAVDVFYRRHLCRTDPWPDFLDRSLANMNLTCYEAMWGPNEFTCTGVLAGYDGTDGLGRIEVPTLFTCGAFDEATPHSTEAFAARVDDAEFQVFTSSSHMAFIEERDAYVACLRKFLRSHDS